MASKKSSRGTVVIVFLKICTSVAEKDVPDDLDEPQAKRPRRSELTEAMLETAKAYFSFNPVKSDDHEGSCCHLSSVTPLAGFTGIIDPLLLNDLRTRFSARFMCCIVVTSCHFPSKYPVTVQIKTMNELLSILDTAIGRPAMSLFTDQQLTAMLVTTQ